MSDLAAQLEGRRVSGVIALSPRTLAVAFGERPRSYLWIHLERKIARLALADRLPSAADPRGSPFGAIEEALRGLAVVRASLDARGLVLDFAEEASGEPTHRLGALAERTRVNLIVTGGAERGVLWAFHRDAEGGAAEAPTAGFRAPAVEVAAEGADQDALSAAVAGAFDEDFRRHLSRELKTAERSLARRLQAQEGDLTRARSHRDARRWGEILLAHYGEIPRGASRVRLPDPFADSPGATVDIDIDPSLTPQENAARLFQKAKKGERGALLVETRLQRTRERLAALDELRRDLFERPPRDALRMLRAFLEAAALPPLPRGDTRTIHLGRQTTGAPRGLRPRHRSPGAHESIRPRTFHTGDGWEVWVGRNNVDNDRITHRLSNPHDYWFHVVGVPGSHVILRRPARNAIPKPRTLEEAASIAAYFSKARKQTRVPVIYTERKFVSKPRRGKPGQAICTRERELLVRPRLPEADAGRDNDREVSS
jgi:fibronectin-binding protein A (FbpA)/ribosomal quality control pathway NFACT family protein